MNFMNKYYFWTLLILFLGLLNITIGLFMIMNNTSMFMDWELISVNSCNLVLTLFFDWMSLSFMGCVMLISSMVIYYSQIYMDYDVNNIRFLVLVLFFILSMMMMIISPNLIMILIGWDGLGLISYCLVIYFNNYNSYNSGMLTILTNRIGDVGILLGVGVMFNLGSWHFLYYIYYSYECSLFLCLLMIISSFTKSAQIPFSSWLPAAMAAPTPVSALVHSSTLVTAGVYLLIRFVNLLNQFDLTFFLLISLLTMFMSGLGANFEFDLSKIIALSTLSQLGLMMSALFLGYDIISFFHLLTHAFFKALLFLCGGLMIHCMNDSQDIRYMGNLINQLPLMSTCFMISNLSLCGLPFLSGFYSKDLIIEFMSLSTMNLFIYLLFFISIGLTVSYSVRLVYYCMLGYNNLIGFSNYYENKIMTNSMIFLVILSITGGSLLSWLLFNNPTVIILSLELKIMCLIMIMIGGWVGYEFYFFYYKMNLMGLNFMSFIYFLGKMWFMPNFSTYMISNVSFVVSNECYNLMDNEWGEYSSTLFSSYFIFLSNFMVFYQNNNIKFFFYSFILMILIFTMI
uniref:NADH-ubiquinone oxidoreductase chain 5 n=1 Tax=Anacestra spiniger TaxID=2813426 RepID=A0A8T9ZYP3_9HEMI|nr:NADH dehydrogenase subunit 5 [Anacestra spiniger]